MARLENSTARFIGTSKEDKPAGSADTLIPAGSSYLETDTGRIFRYDGAGWTYVAPADAVPAILEEILVVLYRLLLIGSVAFGDESDLTEEEDSPTT